MTKEDIEIGMVIRFQFELKAYKNKWMYSCGIVLKKTNRSLWVYCLRNGHNTVVDINGIRYLKQLPWEFVV